MKLPLEAMAGSGGRPGLDPQRSKTLRLLVEALNDSGGASPASSAEQRWRRHLEENILLLLATVEIPGGTVQSPCVGECDARSVKDDYRLQKMLAYIRQRMYAPISLQDLAQATGVSPRGLNDLCKRVCNTSPMTLLRNLRLDAARDCLVNAPDSNIASVAIAHGFEHRGRFSGYYRERFGELPGQTGSQRAAPRATR